MTLDLDKIREHAERAINHVHVYMMDPKTTLAMVDAFRGMQKHIRDLEMGWADRGARIDVLEASGKAKRARITELESRIAELERQLAESDGLVAFAYGEHFEAPPVIGRGGDRSAMDAIERHRARKEKGEC